MALPPLTPEQRAAALEKAAKARKDRAEVKNRLKHGSTTLPSVLKEGQTDDVVGKMKVSALLESMPGVGKVRAKQIMERLGIAESRERGKATRATRPRASPLSSRASASPRSCQGGRRDHAGGEPRRRVLLRATSAATA